MDWVIKSKSDAYSDHCRTCWFPDEWDWNWKFRFWELIHWHPSSGLWRGDLTWICLAVWFWLRWVVWRFRGWGRIWRRGWGCSRKCLGTASRLWRWGILRFPFDLLRRQDAEGYGNRRQMSLHWSSNLFFIFKQFFYFYYYFFEYKWNFVVVGLEKY